MNWAPPVNQNETDIDYYEVTLIGSHTSNTTMIERLPSTQTATFSYNFGVSDTNYSAVNITAVDLCGQRSEPSQTMLNLTSPTGCPSNQIASISQRPEMIVSSILLAITTILLVS